MTLTVEQVEKRRRHIHDLARYHSPETYAEFDALCDLAKAALTGEEVWVADIQGHRPIDLMSYSEAGCWECLIKSSGLSATALRDKGWTVTRCRIVRVV